jgi:AcrR family transcriptional regulator
VSPDRYHHGDLPNALRCAAVDVITERGLGSFSLREVARRAGVSHTAPAHHFGDVTGLLTSIAIEGFEHLRAVTSAEAARYDDPAERLVALGRAYVSVGAAYPAHCEVMFRHDVVHDDDVELQTAGLLAYGVLRDTVRDLCEAESIDIDVDEAAKFAWAAMQGLLVLHTTMVRLDELGGREPVGREHLVTRFTGLVVDGLRAQRGRRSPDTADGVRRRQR